MNTQNTNEPPGMYPAITHFADAIAALPREYRRHTSLLKEVDAKAWGPEENLQRMLDQCLNDSFVPVPKVATESAAGEASEVNSVTGASFDNASLASIRSLDPTIVHRRQQYHTLRGHLMAMMVTMDEKNHVINNANEEMCRHIRRLDTIWPHINDEISEEARLGSLKHWAYTETNPTKKSAAPTTRREAAAASLATLHESEAAHRSQDRREAVRRHRTAQHVDSDFDEVRPPVRKTTANGKKRMAEVAVEQAGLGITGAPVPKRKKPDKSAALLGAGLEFGGAVGGRPMSRENSQQENTKKRKASATVASVARKRYVPTVLALHNIDLSRINATNHDSPKLASSPLAGTTGKEAYKRSPALSSVRPAMARGRQNSTNTVDSTKGRPSSLTSNRNVNGAEAANGKGTDSKRKESKADNNRVLDEDVSAPNGINGDHLKSMAMERTSSRSGAKRDIQEDITKASSPRLPALSTADLKSERTARGKASKTSTPIVGTFAESAAETSEPSTNGNGTKPKRPPRQRFKDHGLHDSLSPKGLPNKRPHKKSGSLSFPTSTSFNHSQGRRREDTDPPTKSSTPSELSQPPVGPSRQNSSMTAAGAKSVPATPTLPHPDRSHSDDEDPGPENDVDANDDPDVDENAEQDGEEDEERYCYCNQVSYGEMVACDNDDCPRQWFHLACIGLKSVPTTKKWFCGECKAGRD
jgi:hypothetical protein